MQASVAIEVTVAASYDRDGLHIRAARPAFHGLASENAWVRATRLLELTKATLTMDAVGAGVDRPVGCGR